MQLLDATVASAQINQRVILRVFIAEADPALLLILLHSILLPQTLANTRVDARVLLSLQVFTHTLHAVVQ